MLQNILRKVIFFFTNLSHINFLNCPKFFTLTKSLNTALAPTEMKKKIFQIKFSFIKINNFCQFSQVIKHQLRQIQSFSQSCKIRQGKNRKDCTSTSLQEDHKLFNATAKYPAVQVQILRRLKLVQYRSHKLNSFHYSELCEASLWTINVNVFSNTPK